MPIKLRDPEVALRERYAAAEGIRIPSGHLCHGNESVEAEEVATHVATGVVVEIKGVEGPAQAGLEVAEQCVDPAELKQIVGMLAASIDRLMPAGSGLITLKPLATTRQCSEP